MFMVFYCRTTIVCMLTHWWCILYNAWCFHTTTTKTIIFTFGAYRKIIRNENQNPTLLETKCQHKKWMHQAPPPPPLSLPHLLSTKSKPLTPTILGTETPQNLEKCTETAAHHTTTTTTTFYFGTYMRTIRNQNVKHM